MREIIETIIQSIRTCTFIYGWPGMQNLLIDEVQTQTVILNTLVSDDQLTANGSAIVEVYNIDMMFLDKTAFDLTPVQYDLICRDMRIFREQFLRALAQHEDIFSVTNIRTIDTPKEFDANFTGVIVTFRVQKLAERTC